MSEHERWDERKNPNMTCENCGSLFTQHQETITLEKGDYCPNCGTQFDDDPAMMTYDEEYDWLEEHSPESQP